MSLKPRPDRCGGLKSGIESHWPVCCQTAPKTFPKAKGLEDPPLLPFTRRGAPFLALTCSHSVHRDDSAEVDVYNPAKNEWDKIPSMNQVRLSVGSTGWSHFLAKVPSYIFGRQSSWSGPVLSPFPVFCHLIEGQCCPQFVLEGYWDTKTLNKIPGSHSLARSPIWTSIH